ncbi:MAG: DNA polymerase III subunit alpha [Holosporales bacterium]|jgi:DNA polymerase-3 subunit alpha|nr:DNA polymerase III subunit alpha [Holosporales bacterium]
MVKPKFIHLRVHSAYSLSHGALKVSSLPELCEKFQMPAVAVIDINNLFGVIDISKTLFHKGIQHIIGTQITLKTIEKSGITKYSPIVLLVKSEQGYKNLIKMSTFSYQNPTLSTDGPFITLEHLEQYSKDLICLTGGDSGPLGQLLLQKNFNEAEDLLTKLNYLFKDNLYIELIRHDLLTQKILEPQFLDLALKHNIPIVATNDVCFKNKDMFEAHDVLLCIANGRYLSEENREKSVIHKYFKSQEEMVELFSDLPEAIENTVNIAKRCHFILEERDPILPPFTSESGLSEKDELREQAHIGLQKRLKNQVFPYFLKNFDKNRSLEEPTKSQFGEGGYGAQEPSVLNRLPSKPISPKPHEDSSIEVTNKFAEEIELREKSIKEVETLYTERLERELKVIEDMGFPGYFLIVSDFIKYAKNQNIPVGPGRGSGAGSLVAWALIITDIDPIRFSLIFERFLNPERVSMPDFDIDFCQIRRGEVIEYVKHRYGDNKVAQIITFGKLQARAVLRDVGRVLEIPYSQVDKVCRLIPNNPSQPVTLQEAINGDKVFSEMIQEDATIEKLINIGLKLEGLYRHASTHAAGIVIGGQTLSDIVPLYYDGESTLAITQINMKFIEKVGLLKFDFLGLKTLSVIQYCIDLLKQRGIEICISEIPLDDKKTFELLCSTNVLGVFQLESGGMRDVVKKLRPDRFEDLIALVALYRPGPMDDIPKYLARKHGEEKVIYIHPSLETILEKTYGVMVYQEQVMQIAQVMGGYTLGGADILRRAMGKKNQVEMAAQQKIFIEGAMKNGVSEGIATSVFDLMAKFASYGFNKSHSAPYALISYQTAYLKANFPLEFFAAITSFGKGNTEKLVEAFQDLRANGFELLPPDINKSFVNFVPENGAMRYALSAIKNVGEKAMEELVAEREKNGTFKSMEDFVSRIPASCINKRQLESLIASGAMDQLNSNRKQLFSSIDTILRYANSFKQDRSSAMRSLFSDTTEIIKEPLRLEKNCGTWNLLEKTQKEFEALGFFLKDHPLDIYKDVTQKMDLQNSSLFAQLASENGKTVKFAAIILSKEERISKGGSKFAFVTLSDHFSIFEVPFFSENYAKIRDLIEPGLAVCVEATIKSNSDETYRITGVTLEKLDTNLTSKTKNQFLNFQISPDCDLEVLKEVLQQVEPGDCIIVLHFSSLNIEVKSKITLPSLYNIDSKVKANILAIPGISLTS